MDKFILEETTIKEIHRAFIEGTLTSTELVEMYLKRIEKLDGKVNSVILINPKCKDEARKIDSDIKNDGITKKTSRNPYNS